MAFGRNTAAPSDTTEQPREQAGFFPTNTLRIDVDEQRIIRLMNDPNDPQYPEPGVSAYTMWADVKVGDKIVKRKLFMDKATKFSLPESMHAKIFYRTFMNVYDLTPVVLVQTDPNDPNVVELAQRGNDGRYFTGYKSKAKDTRKFFDDKVPTANKRVMILEAKIGLLQLLEGLPRVTVSVNEAGESVPVGLLDMTLTITERVDPSTRKLVPVAGAQPLTTPDRTWWNLPRYNMDAFSPWPQDAVHKILSGADFDEVMKEFNINRIPKLQVKNEEEPF